MTTTVGSVVFEAELDTRKIAKQVRDLQKELKKGLTPRVDHKELKELNKHLDQKLKHYKEVREYMKRNPLHIAGGVFGGRSTGAGSGASSTRRKVDMKNLAKEMAKEFSASFTKNVAIDKEKLNQLKNKLRTQVNSFFKDVLKTILAPAGGIITGFFQGIGNTAGNLFGEALMDSLGSGFKKFISDLGKKSGEWLKNMWGKATGRKGSRTPTGQLMLPSAQASAETAKSILPLDPSGSTALATSAGKDIGKALQQGIQLGARKEAIKTNLVLKKTTQAAIDAIKKVLRMSSPSQEMIEIGREMERSKALGAKQEAKRTRKTFRDIQDEQLKDLKGNKSKKGSNADLQSGLASFGMALGASVVNPALLFTPAIAPLILPLIPTLSAIVLSLNVISPLLTKLSNNIEELTNLQNRFLVTASTPEGRAEQFGFVQNLADEFSVDFRSLATEYTKFITAAQSSSLVGSQIQELFTSIALSVRALNLTAAESSLVFNAYTQMIGKGVISMEELRLQLGEKFPPAMSIFAKAIGTSQAEMRELASEGALIAEDVLPKVGVELRKTFGSAVTAGAKSFTASITNLRNEALKFNLALVEEFGGIPKFFVDVQSLVLRNLNDFFPQLKEVLATGFIGVSAVLFVGFQQMFSFPKLKEHLDKTNLKIVAFFKNWLTAITPFLVGLAVDLVGKALGAELTSVQSINTGIFNIIFEGFTNLGVTFNRLGIIGKTISDVFSSIFNALNSLRTILKPATVELLALFLMMQQATVLGATYVLPFIKNFTAAVASLGAAFVDVLKKGNLWKRSLAEIVPLLASGNIALTAFELALTALLVSYSRGNFGGQLRDDLEKLRQDVKLNVDSIVSDLKELRNALNQTGETPRTGLAPKGRQILFSRFIFGEEGKKFSDDLLIEMNRLTKEGKISPYDRFAALQTQRFFTNREEDIRRRGLTEFLPEQVNVGNFSFQPVTQAFKELALLYEDIVQLQGTLNETFREAKLFPEQFESGEFQQTYGKAISQIEETDEKIKILQVERREAAKLGTTAGKAEVASIDARLTALLKEREIQSTSLRNVFSTLEDTQSLLEAFQEQIEASDYPPRAKRLLQEMLDVRKEVVQGVVDEIEKRDLRSLVEPFANVWREVAGNISDARKQFELLTQTIDKEASAERLSLYNQAIQGSISQRALGLSLNRSGLNEQIRRRGGVQAQLGSLRAEYTRALEIPRGQANPQIRKQIEETRKQISELERELDGLNVSIAQGTLGLNNAIRDYEKETEDFTRNVLQFVEDWGDFIERSAESFEDLGSRTAEINTTYFDNIAQLEESIEDYGRTLERNLLESSSTFETLTREIEGLTSELSRRSGLTRGGEGVFTELSNLLGESIQTLRGFGRNQSDILLAALDEEEKRLEIAKRIQEFDRRRADIEKARMDALEQLRKDTERFNKDQLRSAREFSNRFKELEAMGQDMGISFLNILQNIQQIEQNFEAASLSLAELHKVISPPSRLPAAPETQPQQQQSNQKPLTIEGIFNWLGKHNLLKTSGLSYAEIVKTVEDELPEAFKYGLDAISGLHELGFLGPISVEEGQRIHADMMEAYHSGEFHRALAETEARIQAQAEARNQEAQTQKTQLEQQLSLLDMQDRYVQTAESIRQSLKGANQQYTETLRQNENLISQAQGKLTLEQELSKIVRDRGLEIDDQLDTLIEAERQIKQILDFNTVDQALEELDKSYNELKDLFEARNLQLPQAIADSFSEARKEIEITGRKTEEMYESFRKAREELTQTAPDILLEAQRETIENYSTQTKTILEGLENEFTTFFTTVARQSETFGDAITNFLRSVGDNLLNVGASLASNAIIQGLLNIFSPQPSPIQTLFGGLVQGGLGAFSGALSSSLTGGLALSSPEAFSSGGNDFSIAPSGFNFDLSGAASNGSGTAGRSGGFRFSSGGVINYINTPDANSFQKSIGTIAQEQILAQRRYEQYA